jgi:hypothetical protein
MLWNLCKILLNTILTASNFHFIIDISFNNYYFSISDFFRDISSIILFSKSIHFVDKGIIFQHVSEEKNN